MNVDELEPQNSQPIFPPDDADSEPTDANPVPLSPTQPQRRTTDGTTADAQPDLAVIPIVGGASGTGTGSGTAGAGSALPFAPLESDRQRADPATRDD